MLKNRRGFTLVEMLVVIGIIAILAALLLPAVNGAVIRARNAAIGIEVNQLATAIEAYKQDKGDYPPNFRDQSVVLRHIRKCYPKADANYIAGFVTQSCMTSSNTFPGTYIDEGEALVFWLSMTDTDPRYPFLSYYNPGTTPLTPSQKKYYDFDESRLAPVNATGTGETVTTPVNSRTADVRAFGINKYAKETYCIYLDSRTYANYLGNVYLASAEQAPSLSAGLRPFWSKTIANAAAPSPADQTKPVNPTTFQIICAGQDGDFGDPSTSLKYFPTGENYEDGDKDNITNFSEGRTLGDKIP